MLRNIINRFKIKTSGFPSYHTRSEVFGFKSSVEKSDAKPGHFCDLKLNNPSLYRYVKEYRTNGHKFAQINPLIVDKINPDIDPSSFGVTVEELTSIKMGNHDSIDSFLSKAYCKYITIEFEGPEIEKNWLYNRYEEIILEELSINEKKELAELMLKSMWFDEFVGKKFPNVKRYGGEGAESMLAFYHEIFGNFEKYEISDVIIGMAHRGRLNFMNIMMEFEASRLFAKMKGLPEFPPYVKAAGDVLSHLYSTHQIQGSKANETCRISLLPNPSHLEAINPVAAGKTRARHLSKNKGHYSNEEKDDMGKEIQCIMVHGDAALSGQGINQETLQLSQVPHFTVGGSIHLVVNNQIGFTTPAAAGRTSEHSTCLAKQIQAPTIRVNSEAPEDVVRATRLAVEYKRRFQKDVFVDLICYRKWGHNELDDPTFTNPSMYEVIRQKVPHPLMYATKLAEEGIIIDGDVESWKKNYNQLLEDEYEKTNNFIPSMSILEDKWSGIEQASDVQTIWDTGVNLDTLKYIGKKSVSFPDSFAIHPHLLKHHVNGRIAKLVDGSSIDWSTAEALAFGSLLHQGFNIRICGQDVGRATFSHRHAMLVDQINSNKFIPLNSVGSGKLEVVNSTLSEEGVLGFEYGVSLESPRNLVIWEAQFGDFFNGAQIIFDTFISSGESKWGLQSGITILLPHGMDGAGPEHSSCRIERFLQMSDSKETASDGDDVNWGIVNPTTSAQYFHLLRRQMIRNFRKPLIIIAPKILLRHKEAASPLSSMTEGSHFQSIISNNRVDPKKVTKIIFASGKHCVILEDKIQSESRQDIALIRVEQLTPFPASRLQEEVDKYPNAKRFVWSQEEHRNMGCWSYVSPRFENVVGVKLEYVGREELCQPAVGIGEVHKNEIEKILKESLN